MLWVLFAFVLSSSNALKAPTKPMQTPPFSKEQVRAHPNKYTDSARGIPKFTLVTHKTTIPHSLRIILTERGIVVLWYLMVYLRICRLRIVTRACDAEKWHSQVRARELRKQRGPLEGKRGNRRTSHVRAAHG
jgi:hypothetical protein